VLVQQLHSLQLMPVKWPASNDKGEEGDKLVRVAYHTNRRLRQLLKDLAGIHCTSNRQQVMSPAQENHCHSLTLVPERWTVQEQRSSLHLLEPLQTHQLSRRTWLPRKRRYPPKRHWRHWLLPSKRLQRFESQILCFVKEQEMSMQRLVHCSLGFGCLLGRRP